MCLEEMRTHLQAREREAEKAKVKKIRMSKNQVMSKTGQEPQREHPQGY